MNSYLKPSDIKEELDKLASDEDIKDLFDRIMSEDRRLPINLLRSTIEDSDQKTFTVPWLRMSLVDMFETSNTIVEDEL